MRIRLVLLSVLLSALTTQSAWPQTSGTFQAGAAVVDVTPQSLPVIRNGGFLEGQATRVDDPLHARCIVFQSATSEGSDKSRTERLAIVVVDSCMIPLDLCDQAKQLAHEQTGINVDRIMISATHTHSAPSAMNFTLGSRADETYRAFLPAKIAESIRIANERLQPAKVGYGIVDASTHTKCRRYITRTDKLIVDPFGERTVHAMMHPGHQNPDYVGPSGPIDPWLSTLFVQSDEGKPIAALANFSMHYFGGHPGISADYYGRFANSIAQSLAPGNENFVGIMSQGTSGDLWWGDYSLPRDQKPFNNIDQFVNTLVNLAVESANNVTYQSNPSISMAEKRMTLRRRIPDESRLKWARRMNKLRGDRLPKDRPEVYALQSVHLHENPTDEVVLQAIRIGDVAMCGMPNEVYALTGLKLKRQSPLAATFNVSLANGACGYIPPPEQHALGGYTTWPATTAGLEVQAEPKIVDSVLRLLEEVSNRKRREYAEAETPYSKSIIASDPFAYWRFAEQSGPQLTTSKAPGPSMIALGEVAYHLPGRNGPFGAIHDSHAIQLAGGKLAAKNLNVIESYTVELSFYLGTPTDFRGATATLIARGSDQLVITGTDSDQAGRLQIGDHTGTTEISPNGWHHLAFVRNGDFVQVYVDGKLDISQKVSFVDRLSNTLFIGGDARDTANFEGKIDEVSLFDRALTVDQLTSHLRAAGYEAASHLDKGKLDSEPLSPGSSMKQIRVRDGFRVELVAAEPLVQDPVAIDWSLDGSLWVAEMADYPMGMDGKGKPGGRVRLLRDTDEDGQFDKSTVFMDGVSFPNGVMSWGDGVLVTAAPEVFYAEDTNGDDVADRVEPLLTGFIQANQQLRVNGLRWGLDGWVHCASGAHHVGFGVKTTIHSTKRQKTYPLGSRDFRFLPTTGDFAVASGPSQYGRVRDDFGNWFGVQNSQPLWHYVLDERYVARNALVPTIDPRNQVRTPRMPRVYSAKPPQKRFHGFDHAGHYTSACGISIYRDELLFPREELHAFTCAPFHNLVQHHVLTDDGTSFRGERADDGPTDFFASADRWTRPVMSRTGPDGALWIVDMYRYMIEHPEWLPESARQEMLPGYRAGENLGRIYRIVPDGDSKQTSIATVKHGSTQSGSTDFDSTAQLLEALASENGIRRDLAHRQLLTLQESDQAKRDTIIQGVRPLASHHLAEVRIQSLSLLATLGGCDAATLQRAAKDSRAEIRRHAILLAEQALRSSSANKIPTKEINSIRRTVQRLSQDSDAKVRLQAAFTLGEWNDEASGRALVKLAARADNDQFTSAAIVSSAPNHYAALCDLAIHTDVGEPLFRALLKMGPTHPKELAKLISAKTSINGAEKIANWLDDQKESLAELAKSTEHPLASAARGVTSLTMKLRQQPEGSHASQAAACWLLGREPKHYKQDIGILASIIAPQSPAELQQQAVQAMSRIYDDSVAEALLSASPQMLPATRSAITDALLSRPRWAVRLMEAIEEKSISASDLTLAQQQRLTQSRAPDLARRAKEAFTRHESTDTQHADLLAEYASEIVATGDIERGGALFKTNCQTCHTLNPNEQPIGPDLRSLTNRDTGYLLSAILTPSKSIEPRYTNYQVETSAGQTYVGIIAKDDASSIELQTANGKTQIVSRAAIEDIQRSPISLMPDGFETKLSPVDLSDLFAFLRSI